VVSFVKLDNGFEVIEVANSLSTAKIALQGAHIFSFKPRTKDELLWVSKASAFEHGIAIRGGIPICWPWFGFADDKTLPQHGFARTVLWEFEGSQDDEKLFFKLTTDGLAAKLTITITDKLTLELTTTNKSDKDFTLSQAFHTYFAITEITDISVSGLDKKEYIDALSWQRKTQNGDIEFDQEVDRVYLGVDGNIRLHDKNRTINITNDGSSSAIVWNPWIEKTKRMSNMLEDDYKEFVCIESANAFDDARVLKAGESHTLGVVLEVDTTQSSTLMSKNQMGN
jgi:glucose-6-phosphate 1-epimerase